MSKTTMKTVVLALTLGISTVALADWTPTWSLGNCDVQQGSLVQTAPSSCSFITPYLTTMGQTIKKAQSDLQANYQPAQNGVTNQMQAPSTTVPAANEQGGGVGSPATPVEVPAW